MLASAADARASYVAAVYQDLLYRDVDAAGKAYWVDRLEQGELIDGLAASIVHSREFLVDKINAAYAAILARTPDRQGLDYWIERSGEQLEAGLLAADEFYERVGGNDQAYIQAVYQAALGRPADEAGQEHWFSELAAGHPRAEIVSEVTHSLEAEHRLVEQDYQRIFQRAADPSGLAHWSGQLAAGISNDEVLIEIVTSADYFKEKTGEPVTVVPTTSTLSWWATDNAQINARAQQGAVDLMFVGDSITAGWNIAGFGTNVWNEYYAGRNAMNAGIRGDETQSLLWRLEHGNLDNVQPKLVVLMIGTNNLSANDSPADVASGVQAVLDVLRARLPESKILLMGILPRGETANDPLRHEVAATNSLLVNMADGKTVYYRDIGQALLSADGSFLPGVVFPDYTHLTQSGYEIWASEIEPLVKALVG
ncbi:MAG TPA: DUF4214 domain-containing protein [Pirellulales bacterium]|nr:DUF4214 domain-containing protein [Pirellulales bacterium]